MDMNRDANADTNTNTKILQIAIFTKNKQESNCEDNRGQVK